MNGFVSLIGKNMTDTTTTPTAETPAPSTAPISEAPTTPLPTSPVDAAQGFINRLETNFTTAEAAAQAWPAKHPAVAMAFAAILGAVIGIAAVWFLF